MKKEKLPRGITRRKESPDSLVVSFAFKDTRCKSGKHVPDCECGKIKHRSLGPVSVGFAKEQLAIFKRQVRQGEYQEREPRPEPPPEPVKETTGADLWDAYKKDCETRDVKRIDRLVFAWKHLEPVFGRRPASAIKPRAVADYVAARRAAGAAAATCNREVAILKAAFRHGARLELVAAVPLFPKKLKETNIRTGFVNEEQYEHLAAKASEPWLRAFVALGFSFGFRKSEMLNLRVRDVDLLDGWLTLETSKNGEGRRIALTAETKRLLARCIRGKRADDFVLTHEDGSRVSQPRKNWYSLCVSCGLGKLDEDGRYQGLQMHDLRRSAVRRLVRRGVPEKTCMSITGHKTRSVFDRYNIVIEGDLEDAARRLEKASPSAAAGSENGSETATKTATRVFARA